MIHEYNYKPNPIILLTKEEEQRLRASGKKHLIESIASVDTARKLRYQSLPMCIGMELEIELVKGKPREQAADISGQFDRASNELHLYFKRDSSLMNGFEIVSHPRSIASWMSIKNRFKDLMLEMRKVGFRSYDTGRCGMHFHINRSAFSGDMHIAKFIRFWQENSGLSFALSRRTESSMAKYAHFQKHKGELLAALIYNFGYGRTVGLKACHDMPNVALAHHSAVTLTHNTVEIRIFRGTMNVNTILTTMEMVAKVLSVTRECSMSNLSVNELIKFIPDNKKNKKILKMLSLDKKVDEAKLYQPEGRNREESRYAETKRILEGQLKANIGEPRKGVPMLHHWIAKANEMEVSRIVAKSKKMKANKGNEWQTETIADRGCDWRGAVRNDDEMVISLGMGLMPTTLEHVNLIARRNLQIGYSIGSVIGLRTRLIRELTLRQVERTNREMRTTALRANPAVGTGVFQFRTEHPIEPVNGGN